MGFKKQFTKLQALCGGSAELVNYLTSRFFVAAFLILSMGCLIGGCSQTAERNTQSSDSAILAPSGALNINLSIGDSWCHHKNDDTIRYMGVIEDYPDLCGGGISINGSSQFSVYMSFNDFQMHFVENPDWIKVIKVERFMK